MTAEKERQAWMRRIAMERRKRFDAFASDDVLDIFDELLEWGRRRNRVTHETKCRRSSR
jgi:hypothetical protein